MRTKQLTIVLVSLLAGFGFLAVAGPGHDHRGRSDASYAIEQIAERSRGLQTIHGIEHMGDLVPSTRLEHPDGRRSVPVGSVVLGTVEAIEVARSYANDPSGSREVGRDSPLADWRLLRIEIQVDRSFGDIQPQRIVGGITVGSAVDVGRFESGLRALGRLLVPIGPPSDLWELDEPLGMLSRNGTLLGTVDPSGVIALPALPPAEAQAFLGEHDTIVRYAEAVEQPARVIAVSHGGEPLARRIEGDAQPPPAGL